MNIIFGDALETLPDAISNGKIVESLPDRKVILSDIHGQKSIVDLRFNEKEKVWLVTTYLLI